MFDYRLLAKINKLQSGSAFGNVINALYPPNGLSAMSGTKYGDTNVDESTKFADILGDAAERNCHVYFPKVQTAVLATFDIAVTSASAFTVTDVGVSHIADFAVGRKCIFRNVANAVVGRAVVWYRSYAANVTSTTISNLEGTLTGAVSVEVKEDRREYYINEFTIPSGVVIFGDSREDVILKLRGNRNANLCTIGSHASGITGVTLHANYWGQTSGHGLVLRENTRDVMIEKIQVQYAKQSGIYAGALSWIYSPKNIYVKGNQDYGILSEASDNRWMDITADANTKGGIWEKGGNNSWAFLKCINSGIFDNARHVDTDPESPTYNPNPFGFKLSSSGGAVNIINMDCQENAGNGLIITGSKGCNLTNVALDSNGADWDAATQHYCSPVVPDFDGLHMDTSDDITINGLVTHNRNGTVNGLDRASHRRGYYLANTTNRIGIRLTESRQNKEADVNAGTNNVIY